MTGNLDTAVANVDFRLYGPGDTNCTGEPVFVSLNRPVTVVADGQSFYATAESAHYNALLAGKYRWTAHFDGDANNADADSLCNATNEDSTVERANPAIPTTATSGTFPPPGTITDRATLTGVTESAGGASRSGCTVRRPARTAPVRRCSPRPRCRCPVRVRTDR